MSSETLVAVNVAYSSLSDLVEKIYEALSSRSSVHGLFSIKRVLKSPTPQYRTKSIVFHEDSFVSAEELTRLKEEIDNCTNGLTLRWEVERFQVAENKSGLESWRYHLDVVFQHPLQRDWTLSGLSESIFVDPGGDQYFSSSALHGQLACEAASLNLELLVDELSALVEIPVQGLKGIPVRTLAAGDSVPPHLAWLYYDYCHRPTSIEVDQHIRTTGTSIGDIYYSTRGPLGNLSSLKEFL